MAADHRDHSDRPGQPNTVADPNWIPLANTANDPSYPGAHATFSQAAATVLEDFFGTDVFSFSLTNPTVGITRSFASFSQASDEASASRIFAGQHFRYDEEAGQTLGSQVAGFVADHALLPTHEGGRKADYHSSDPYPRGAPPTDAGACPQHAPAVEARHSHDARPLIHGRRPSRRN